MMPIVPVKSLGSDGNNQYSSGGRMRSIACCRYSAVVSFYSAHTGTAAGEALLIVQWLIGLAG